MGSFRCPYYWWDGNNWRCRKLGDDYLNSYDFDTFCTSETRCRECPYYNR